MMTKYILLLSIIANMILLFATWIYKYNFYEVRKEFKDYVETQKQKEKKR